MKNLMSLSLIAVLFVGCFGSDEETKTTTTPANTWGSDEFQVVEYSMAKGLGSMGGEELKTMSFMKRKLMNLVQSSNVEFTKNRRDGLCDMLIEAGATFPMSDDDGCTISCEAGTSILGSSCENVNTNFSCEHNYSMTGMNYTGSFDFADADFSGEEPAGSVVVEFSVSGTIDGGSFSDSNMSCEMEFIMSMTQENVDFDCSQVTTATCTFAETTYSCEELDAMATGTNSCH